MFIVLYALKNMKLNWYMISAKPDIFYNSRKNEDLQALVKRYHKRHGTALPIRYILARAKINRTKFLPDISGGDR